MLKDVSRREAFSGLRGSLLAWYDRNRRDLPWRRSRDPYAIWVSEIMLQQTRVAVVAERYRAFMERFPTIDSLAGAAEQEVLALWSGLGYYRRARLMQRAARQIVEDRGGIMPDTAAELRSLPGIGGYTSAAIASIAHGEPVAVVDGNVERVLCRLAGWDVGRGSAALRTRIENLASRLLDRKRPGDFNQAVMELGATVCAPRNPQCLVCPILKSCKTRGEHKTAPRASIVSCEAAHALCVRERKNRRAAPEADEPEILLEQRPASASVMPGLWELPRLRDGEREAALPRIEVRHAIMQVNYRVRIHDVDDKDAATRTLPGGERRWVSPKEADGMALTGLARKVLKKTLLLPAAETAPLLPKTR